MPPDAARSTLSIHLGSGWRCGRRGRTSRIELRLQCIQRTVEQRPLIAEKDALVIAFGLQQIEAVDKDPQAVLARGDLARRPERSLRELLSL